MLNKAAPSPKLLDNPGCENVEKQIIQE